MFRVNLSAHLVTADDRGYTVEPAGGKLYTAGRTTGGCASLDLVVVVFSVGRIHEGRLAFGADMAAAISAVRKDRRRHHLVRAA